jgi:hypothetical protein
MDCTDSTSISFRELQEEDTNISRHLASPVVSARILYASITIPALEDQISLSGVQSYVLSPVQYVGIESSVDSSCRSKKLAARTAASVYVLLLVRAPSWADILFRVS